MSISRLAVKLHIIQYGRKGRVWVDMFVCVCNVHTDIGVLGLNFVYFIPRKNLRTENFVVNFKTLLRRKQYICALYIILFLWRFSTIKSVIII